MIERFHNINVYRAVENLFAVSSEYNPQLQVTHNELNRENINKEEKRESTFSIPVSACAVPTFAEQSNKRKRLSKKFSASLC